MRYLVSAHLSKDLVLLACAAGHRFSRRLLDSLGEKWEHLS